jgi:hypothetical protein
MNALRAVARAFGELRLLATLLVANLCIALIGSLPVLLPALRAFSHSGLERGRAFPSPAAWNDFARVLERSGGFLAGTLAVGTLGGFAVQFVASSGIASRAWAGGRFRLADFLGDAGHYLGRNIRLFLWSLIGLGVVIGVAAGSTAALDAMERKTFFTADAFDWVLDPPFTAASVAQLVLLLMLYAVWRAGLDLARIQMVATEEKKTRKLAWRALKTLTRSPLAVGAYALISLAGVACVLVFARIRGSIAETTAARAWLALAVAQIAIWIRLGFVVAGYQYVAGVERADRERGAVPVEAPAAPPPEPVIPPTAPPSPAPTEPAPTA